jgi:hypothetical protein
MAQGLKMADALNGIRNGFLINNAAPAEADFKPEALSDYVLQHLKLNLAHQLHLYFAEALIPDNAQLRILSLMEFDFLLGGVNVCALR